jgi:hypothetical protein
MNNLGHISKSLETIFYVKILNFDLDPGWKKFGSGMEKFRIRDKHPESATLIKRDLILPREGAQEARVFSKLTMSGSSLLG